MSSASLAAALQPPGADVPGGFSRLIEQIESILNGGRWLRFPPDLERRFEGEVDDARRRHHITIALIGLVLFDAFLVGDAKLIPDIYPFAVWIRLAVCTPLVLAMLVLDWRRMLTPRARELLSALAAIGLAASLVLFMTMTHSPHASHYYLGLPLMVIYPNSLQRIRFRYAVCATTAIVVLATWGLLIAPAIPDIVRQTFVAVFVATAVLTLLALFRIEHDERYTWLLRLRESCLARHDPLTGLPNRRAVEEHLGAQLQQARQARGASPLYLMYLDLDHFKLVNDTCGHAAGDRLLREISTMWRDHLRPQDFVARIGGDEFVVVLRDLPESVARSTGERLIAATEQYRFLDNHNVFTVGLSVGLVMLDGEATNLTDLFIQADMACYAAKQMGRGRLSQYNANGADIVSVKHTVDWGPRIRRALDQNRFRLYLQKIVGSSGATEGYEALIRLVDETGKTVSPGEFLPPAKRLGLMTAIDRWVCTQAFAQLERGAPRQGYISVNLMPNSISEPQFARWLLAELRSRPRLAGRLRFEIIETEQLHLGAAEQALFEQLHELGFGLFLDDFGSGYNSFEIVKRLPLDGIKLDGTVVRDYLTDPVDQALVQAAVSIARRMGLTLVAEGVENQAICQALADLGVHSFQGYLFHIPEPVESVCAHESAQPAAPAYSPAAATTEALAAGARRAPRG